MSFADATIPNVTDAQHLANGDPPSQIVLPLSVAAAWAYADQRVFDIVMKRRGLASAPSKFIEVVNDTMFVTAKAYVQKVGAGAIVAFRGTEPTNLINWLADASLQKVAFHAEPGVVPHGYVHGGFYRNTRAIWPEVLEALHELRPEWVYLTGHSFGAALAVLAGALLADYEAQKPEYAYLWRGLRGIVTFGQPMVGDAAFAQSYAAKVQGKLVRFVYKHDIVPHLPPKTDGWEPVHFGDEFRAPEGTKWVHQSQLALPIPNVLGSNLLAVASWVKDQAGLAPRVDLPYSWGDHAPNNYVRVSLPAGADSGSEFD
jgi:hypothetical protein